MVGQGAKGCGALGVFRSLEQRSQGEAILRDLPEDIQWYTWRIFFKHHIVPELYGKYQHIWECPSDRLLDLCRDKGCIQQGSSELEDLIEDENMWAWNICVNGKCENCSHYGFPCHNLAQHGFQIPRLGCQWEANF